LPCGAAELLGELAGAVFAHVAAGGDADVLGRGGGGAMLAQRDAAAADQAKAEHE